MGYKIDKLESIARRVFDLYVNYRENYIEQVDDGSYITYKEKGTYLGVGYVRIHLEGNRTFGICDEKASKVMIFDIDEDNLKAVNGIFEILREYGFTENCLQVFFSGNKGYHVTCYFDKPVELNQLNLFQACVMVKLHDQYPELSNLKVDLRPTPVYGVKLPLGIHRITGKRCCFCDKDTFNHIESFGPIFAIEQFSRTDFNNKVMKKITDENNKNGLAQRAMKYSSSYGFSLSGKNSDCETVDDILTVRIPCPHSRHIILFDISIRLKRAGVNKTECEKLLQNWMNLQDINVYSTPLHQCMKDIHEMVHYIYRNESHFKEESESSGTIGKNMGELMLTYDEVKFILSFPNSKIWSVILFIMKYHKNGLSYYQKWQAHAISTIINECSDGNDIFMQAKTVRGYLKLLSDIGFIKVNTAKLSEGENPQSGSGKNNVPQNYYYCRFGNCPTEIAVQSEFKESMGEDSNNVCVIETENKSYREILLEAVNFFGMREELFESMSKRNFKNLFGNNKKAA